MLDARPGLRDLRRSHPRLPVAPPGAAGVVVESWDAGARTLPDHPVGEVEAVGGGDDLSRRGRLPEHQLRDDEARGRDRPVGAGGEGKPRGKGRERVDDHVGGIDAVVGGGAALGRPAAPDRQPPDVAPIRVGPDQRRGLLPEDAAEAQPGRRRERPGLRRGGAGVLVGGQLHPAERVVGVRAEHVERKRRVRLPGGVGDRGPIPVDARERVADARVVVALDADPRNRRDRRLDLHRNRRDPRRSRPPTSSPRRAWSRPRTAPTAVPGSGRASCRGRGRRRAPSPTCRRRGAPASRRSRG